MFCIHNVRTVLFYENNNFVCMVGRRTMKRVLKYLTIQKEIILHYSKQYLQRTMVRFSFDFFKILDSM